MSVLFFIPELQSSKRKIKDEMSMDIITVTSLVDNHVEKIGITGYKSG